MRIATTIISLFLILIIGLQSCAVAFGGTLSSDESLSAGGAIGMLVAFLFLIGGAFAIAFPLVSLASFALATFLALLASIATEFSDMMIWAFLSLVLAVMSFFRFREKQKVDERTQRVR